MAARKRSKAVPKKKPRSGRKPAPRSSSKQPAKKKRATVARSHTAKPKPKAKKKPIVSAKKSKTKPKKKSPAKPRVSKKTPAKRTKAPAVKTIKAKKPARAVKKTAKPKTKPKTKATVKPTKAKKPAKSKKTVKPQAAKPKAPKPPKLVPKLTREDIEHGLEAHALAHAPLYKTHDPRAMGRDRHGIYTSDAVNVILNEDTVDDVIHTTLERGKEVAEMIQARARGEGRVILWASYLVSRTLRGRNEGYSEESVVYNHALKQEVGIFWTGIRGSAPSRFPAAVRQKVADMASTPSFLVAIFVYGRWARGSRRKRSR